MANEDDQDKGQDQDQEPKEEKVLRNDDEVDQPDSDHDDLEEADLVDSGPDSEGLETFYLEDEEQFLDENYSKPYVFVDSVPEDDEGIESDESDEDTIDTHDEEFQQESTNRDEEELKQESREESEISAEADLIDVKVDEETEAESVKSVIAQEVEGLKEEISPTLDYGTWWHIPTLETEKDFPSSEGEPSGSRDDAIQETVKESSDGQLTRRIIYGTISLAIVVVLAVLVVLFADFGADELPVVISTISAVEEEPSVAAEQPLSLEEESSVFLEVIEELPIVEEEITQEEVIFIDELTEVSEETAVVNEETANAVEELTAVAEELSVTTAEPPVVVEEELSVNVEEPLFVSTETTDELMTLDAITGNSYIIVASFPTEDLAREHAGTLPGNGEIPMIIPPFGRGDNYRVAIASYVTWAEADANIPQYREVYGDDIWALRYGAASPAGVETMLNERTGYSYIIISSFQDEDLARNHAGTLTATGEEPVIIPPFGQISYYLVAIFSYDTFTEAQEALPQYRDEYGDDIWALRY